MGLIINIDEDVDPSFVIRTKRAYVKPVIERPYHWYLDRELVNIYKREQYKNTSYVDCKCGGRYKLVNKHKHIRSKMHIRFIK